MEVKNQNNEEFPIIRTLGEFQPAPIVDEVSVTVKYVGFGQLGTPTSEASWKVMKIEKVGTVTTTYYADGDMNYDNIWDNRASLVYKR